MHALALVLLAANLTPPPPPPSLEIATPAPAAELGARRLPKAPALVTSGLSIAAIALGVGFAIDASDARSALYPVRFTQAEAIARANRANMDASISTAAFAGALLLGIGASVLAGFTGWVD